MELKTTVHIICWGVIDGLAALWVLHVLVNIVDNKYILGALGGLVQAICG